MARKFAGAFLDGAWLASQHTAPQAQQPAEVLLPSQITEEMHQAACKVLIRAVGLDGTPQRMLDAMQAVRQKAGLK